MISKERKSDLYETIDNSWDGCNVVSRGMLEAREDH
jgi:hypothetical protein